MKKGIAILVAVLIVLGIVAGVIVAQAYGSDETDAAPTGDVQPSSITSVEDDTPLASDEVSVNVNPNEDRDVVEINGTTYRRKENVVNVLLLGIDSDADRVRENKGWRSDMIMLCSIDKDTNQITFTSIPRDSRADVYHLDGDGQITSQVTEKLNHAYAYGGGPNRYSAENAMRCTSEFLACGGMINVPIDYYVSIDLDGVPKLANELGGVPVTLEQDIPDVGDKGDTVELRGETTRKFLQNRYDMADGETDRQRHEQKFMRSMANIIKDMGARDAAPELYDTFLKFMKSNLSLDQVLELAGALDATSMDNIQFNVMTEGSPEVIGGTWYYRCSQDEMLKMMLSALYNQE